MNNDEEIQRLRKVLGTLIVWLQMELGAERATKLLEQLGTFDEKP